MWECDFDKLVEEDLDFQDVYNDIHIDEPLNPREGFFGKFIQHMHFSVSNNYVSKLSGGRTNCRKMHHIFEPGTYGAYVDVTSLYPFVCKYGKFPIGHPEVITENFFDITTKPYDGMIKVCNLMYCNVL